MSGRDNMEPLVKMTNISKSFAFVKAIDQGCFDLIPGEIHSLIGENGAGKSTMMKILYGMYKAEEGQIFINGKRLDESYNTSQAIAHNIGMVHQEFMLADDLTVLENIILGNEPVKKRFLIDWGSARKKIKTYIEKYHLEVHLDKTIRNISVGEAQRVEIIKALYRDANILILDEPTAVLTPQETDRLFEILNFMVKDGKSIIFISHKLKEVMQISNRISVMRGGKYIGTIDKKDASVAELANMMVGREINVSFERRKIDSDEVLLSVRDLYAASGRELAKLKGISFDLHKGEILGIAGVDGNGQTELGKCIAGLIPAESGEICIDGKNVTNKPTGYIRAMGLSNIPEDRNVDGLNKTETIEVNLATVGIDNAGYKKWGMVNPKKISEHAAYKIAKYDVRPANGKVNVGTLSGGNAQKIIVAREVDAESKVIIAAQPTRGIDIAAIASIRKLLNQATDSGRGVILISADLDEVLSLSDRIIVLYEGRVAGEVVNDGSVSNMELGLMMTGGKSYE